MYSCNVENPYHPYKRILSDFISGLYFEKINTGGCSFEVEPAEIPDLDEMGQRKLSIEGMFDN